MSITSEIVLGRYGAGVLSDHMYGSLSHALVKGWWDDQADLDRLAFLTTEWGRVIQDLAAEDQDWETNARQLQYKEVMDLGEAVAKKYNLIWNARSYE